MVDEPCEDWQGTGDWVPTECGPRILPDTPDRVCTAGDGLPLPPSPKVKRAVALFWTRRRRGGARAHAREEKSSATTTAE